MIFSGLKKLLESSKGWMCLIIFFGSMWLCYEGKLNTPFAMIVSSIVAIFCYTRHKTDMAAMGYNAMYPQPYLNPAIGTPDAPIQGVMGVNP